MSNQCVRRVQRHDEARERERETRSKRGDYNILRTNRFSLVDAHTLTLGQDLFNNTYDRYAPYLFPLISFPHFANASHILCTFLSNLSFFLADYEIIRYIHTRAHFHALFGKWWPSFKSSPYTFLTLFMPNTVVWCAGVECISLVHYSTSIINCV